MKLENERTEQIYKFDLDLSREEAIFLQELAIKAIQKDPQALIEYAVIRLLGDQIRTMSDKMDKGIAGVRKDILKRSKKNGTKN